MDAAASVAGAYCSVAEGVGASGVGLRCKKGLDWSGADPGCTDSGSLEAVAIEGTTSKGGGGLSGPPTSVLSAQSGEGADVTGAAGISAAEAEPVCASTGNSDIIAGSEVIAGFTSSLDLVLYG